MPTSINLLLLARDLPEIYHRHLRLSERELAIPGRRHRLAALAKGGVAAAVAHDPPDLLALDIAVDAGHPRVDLGEQQALARRNDVVGPGDCARRSGLDAGQVAVARETDQTGHFSLTGTLRLH